MDYYNILKKTNNQIIDIINYININKNDLEFLYYTCCLLGGYESIDNIIHQLVLSISNVIEIDLSLYYPFKVDINKRIIETKKYLNFYDKNKLQNLENFINRINKLPRIKNKSKYLDEKYKRFFDYTFSLRGFNQEINFNKVFLGTLRNNGRVLDYFINNKDIEIIEKLINKWGTKTILKAFYIYFQVPQIMLPNYTSTYNFQTTIVNENICSWSYKNKNCKPNDKNYNTNLCQSLLYYGDCREQSLIALLFNSIIEWSKYLKLISDFNKNKKDIYKLVKNQYRSISGSVALSGHFSQKYLSINNKKYYFNNIEIKENDELNEYEKKNLINYKNKKYIISENHVFCLRIKFKDNDIKIKCYDIMYNKFQEQIKDTPFIGDSIIHNKKPKLNIKDDKYYLEFGSTYTNNDIDVIFYVDLVIYKEFRWNNYNNKNKWLLLSNEKKLNELFWNIDKFIEWRENNVYYLRKKYFKMDRKVKKFDKNEKDILETRYFLMDDFI